MGRWLLALLMTAAAALPAAAGAGDREGNRGHELFVFFMMLYFGCPSVLVSAMLVLLVIGLIHKPKPLAAPSSSPFPQKWEPLPPEKP